MNIEYRLAENTYFAILFQTQSVKMLLKVNWVHKCNISISSPLHLAWWSVFYCLWNLDDTLLVLQRIMVTAWMIMFFFFPKTFGTLWMVKESKILFLQQTFKKNEYWKCSSVLLLSTTLISSWLPLLRKHRCWIHFAGSFCNVSGILQCHI